MLLKQKILKQIKLLKNLKKKIINLLKLEMIYYLIMVNKKIIQMMIIKILMLLKKFQKKKIQIWKKIMLIKIYW